MRSLQPPFRQYEYIFIGLGTTISCIALVISILSWIDSKENIKNTRDQLSTAQTQLESVKKQMRADFLLRLNNEFFFTERMYKVRRNIESSKDSNVPFIGNGVNQTTPQDIDDYLGEFMLLQAFIEQGILDKALVYEMFSTYVIRAYKNPQIQKYLAKKSGFGGFITLAQEFETIRNSHQE